MNKQTKKLRQRRGSRSLYHRMRKRMPIRLSLYSNSTFRIVIKNCKSRYYSGKNRGGVIWGGYLVRIERGLEAPEMELIER